MVRFVDIDGIEDYLSFHNKQSRSWRGVLDTTFMKFVSDIRHVDGGFPAPPIKLTATEVFLKVVLNTITISTNPSKANNNIRLNRYVLLDKEGMFFSCIKIRHIICLCIFDHI